MLNSVIAASCGIGKKYVAADRPVARVRETSARRVGRHLVFDVSRDPVEVESDWSRSDQQYAGIRRRRECQSGRHGWNRRYKRSLGKKLRARVHSRQRQQGRSQWCNPPRCNQNRVIGLGGALSPTPNIFTHSVTFVQPTAAAAYSAPTSRAAHHPLPHTMTTPLLSCGGLIAQRARAGDLVEIATVFGGRPDMATVTVRTCHPRPARCDRRPDRAATEEGNERWQSSAQPRPGGYLDCIYAAWTDGRWLYDSEEALFIGGPSRRRWSRKRLLSLPRWRRLRISPYSTRRWRSAGIADLRSSSGRRCCYDAGYAILFYEDYPYVVRTCPASGAGS